MFFVVTTGRSGSTTLARVLSQHPLCQCSHERYRVLVRLATERCHGQIDDDELRFYLGKMFPHRIGLRLYGESNQKLSYLIPLLAEQGQKTRFIWLIRDGRNVVASMFSRGAYGNEQVPGPSSYWVKYRVQGDLCGDVSPEIWQSMSAFEKCCWYWTFTNRTIESNLKRIDETSWVMVKLEELNKRLNSILDLLDLPFFPLKMSKANVNPISPYNFEIWDKAQQAAFDFWCGESMDCWYPRWREDLTMQCVEPDKGFQDKSTKALLAASSHVRWFAVKGITRLTARAIMTNDKKQHANLS